MTIQPELGKRLPEQLKLREWVSAAHVGFQQQILTFLFWAYGLLLATTMGIFYLQGFHVGNFSLDSGLLRWLGGATIGEIGGLMILAIRASFK